MAGQSAGGHRKLIRDAALGLVKERVDEAIRQHNIAVSAIPQDDDGLVKEHQQRLDVFQYRHQQVQTSMVDEQCDLKEETLRMSREVDRFLAGLPMYSYQTDIINMVHQSQVSILIGDTGSGKSTQVCQYLYEHGFSASERMIVCTQPRKVAATSLAERVSSEMKTTLGRLVGYQVGMKKNVTKHTRILFSTDHCLLNECLKDSLFTKYSVLVVDEAHERSIYTDLLLGLIKKCLPKRPDLKVIITSATIDPTVFQKYFGNCPKLDVPGRMYPVDLAYARPSFPSAYEYCQSVMDKVKDVHLNEGPGDILAFMVTPLDCEKCCELLVDLENAICMPLHGQLNAEKYKEVMAPLTDGKRKIVFATNCAETSITIPGIRYVVDSGFAKEKQFDPRANISKLVICPVSKSSAVQRKGRAGRVESGKYFRLYSEQDFEAMTDIAVPEILRVNLGQAVLQLLALGITDPVSFDFVQSPSKDSIQKAYNLLDSLGAIDVDGRLSDLGKQMVHLPVDPKHAKFILMCCQDNVGYVGIVMATMCMQGNQVFYRGSSDEEKIEADAKKARFLDPKGDVATLMKLFKEWKSQNDHLRGSWCYENSINSKLMKNAYSTAQEIHSCLNRELGITVHREFTMQQLDLVQQNYLTCFFPGHIAFFSGSDRVGYFVPQIQAYCPIHPSSTLRYCGVTPIVVVFENILETGKKYLITVSEVDEIHHGFGGGWIYEEYSKQVVVQHRISNAGPAVQRQLYYSRHQVRQCLKDIFQELVIAPDVQWSTPKTMPQWVDVVVRQDQYAVVNQYLQEAYVKPIVNDLRTKRIETSVGEKSDVKVFLGSGAEVVCCVMPHEYTSVKVQLKRACDRSQLDADKLEQLLSQCGRVTSMKQMDQQDAFWGFANFDLPSSAELAVNSDFDLFRCSPGSNRNHSRGGEDGFLGSLCVEWLRRPTKEHAFVRLPPTVLDAQGFSAEAFVIGDSMCYITRNRKDANNLFLRPIPKDCTQQMIINEGPSFLKSCQAEVIIPREPAENSLDCDQSAISKLLTPILTKAAFPVGSLKFLGQKDTVLFVRCFINTTSVTSCLTLLDLFEREVLIYQCRRVKVTAQLKCFFNISILLYNFLKAAIDEICALFSVETRFQPDRRFPLMGRLTCTTNDHKQLKLLQSALGKVLSGSVIDCVGTFSRTLLTLKHDEALENIMVETGTRIEKDSRQYRLLIFGHDENVSQAKASLNHLIESLSRQHSFENVVQLRGSNRPQGLVKLLLRKFRVDLQKMQDVPGCNSVRLDLRNHEILYVGTADGFEAITREIDQLASELSADQSVAIETQCPICLGEVELESVQLSICGHHYCKECFNDYMENAIQSKQFPLVCYAENCNEHLCIDDVKLTAKLTAAAVERFVATHKDYKFCPTADCANIYRATKTVRTYYCSLCMTATCTCCHKAAHSSNDICSADPDNKALLSWIAADPQNRDKCPGCGQGIEKNGGCLHMNCIKCNAHFCWNCKKEYPSASVVYSHICNAN